MAKFFLITLLLFFPKLILSQNDKIATSTFIDCDTIENIPFVKYQLGIGDIEVDKEVIEIRIWKNTSFMENQSLWILKRKNGKWNGQQIDFKVSYIQCIEKRDSSMQFVQKEKKEKNKPSNKNAEYYPFKYIILDHKIKNFIIQDWNRYIEKLSSYGLFNLKRLDEIKANRTFDELLYASVDGESYHFVISQNSQIAKYDFYNPDDYKDKYVEYHNLLLLIKKLERTSKK